MAFQFFCRIVFFSAWFIESSENNTTTFDCESIRNGGCCDGYYWNETRNICLKCLPGTTGPNCSVPCPYPTFGIQCQGYCECSNETCDVSTGCVTLKTDDKTSFSVMTETTTGGKNNTFYTMTNYTLEASATVNNILIILIQIFGAADMLLICTYSIVIVIDRQRDKNESQNRRKSAPGNNTMYENVEMPFLSND